jgi:hypothetical protein
MSTDPWGDGSEQDPKEARHSDERAIDAPKAATRFPWAMVAMGVAVMVGLSLLAVLLFRR